MNKGSRKREDRMGTYLDNEFYLHGSKNDHNIYFTIIRLCLEIYSLSPRAFDAIN